MATGTKLLVNTTHVYTESEINTCRPHDVRNTLAITPETCDDVGFQTILYLSFIQQLRTNTDITSYEPGRKAVDYLENNLHNTLSNMKEDFDDVDKSLLTSTTTRAHEEKCNIYNITMTALNKISPEIFDNTHNIHLHLHFIQQIRTNTDIASHKLGKESLDYLDNTLYNILLNTEHKAKKRKNL